jgi:hypothetical protein
MPRSGLERRRADRRVPRAEETLARVRLRTGRELAVVDLSSTGALIGGSTRLLPGTHADVHIVTRHGRVLVRTRVVRAWVWRLEPDCVQYRAGLAFDTAVDTEADGYAVPDGPGSASSREGTSYPDPEIGSPFGSRERAIPPESAVHVTDGIEFGG